MARSPKKGNQTTFTSTTANKPLFSRFCLFGLVVSIVIFSAASFGQRPNLAGPIGCSKLLSARHSDPKFISKLEIVYGIMEELSKSRDHFLATGDMVDLFPTLYFHTTKAEFDRALNDESPAGEMMIDLIIAFYDAYSANRKRFDEKGFNSVEPHWRTYFKSAVKANRTRAFSMATIMAILLDGVDAHVVYDLPRAIRWRLPASRPVKSVFKSEFAKMDTLFKRAAGLANRDIITAHKDWGKFASMDSLFGFGASYVINGRHRAWELAVSDNKLPTKEPQPVLPRHHRTKTYFSILDELPVCKSK